MHSLKTNWVSLEAFILIDAFYLEIAWALRTCLEIPRRSLVAYYDNKNNSSSSNNNNIINNNKYYIFYKLII